MPTVLFIHGLESGPQGRKARELAKAGFNVVAVQMPCGRAATLRDPVVMALVLIAVTLIIIGAFTSGIIGAVLALCVVLTLLPLARVWVVRRVFRRSIAVQRRALAAGNIDVVVGSSFGGAVALALLTDGTWTGPTVLMCPAHALVAGRAWLPLPGPLVNAERVVVVHGLADVTVPVNHSRALVAGSDAKLVLVQDDHRLAATATAANLAEWLSLAGVGSS